MALDRSSASNRAETVFMAMGVPMASVAPSATRTRENCSRVRASAWPMAARLHAATPTGLAERMPSRSTSQPAKTSPVAAANWKIEARVP